ncbi:protein MKS1-like [Curcuma longa]|uniref:protein MKS1-like n=1 Tax=Curcuma longa TaxID=136217 RepID=UPI003D9DE661
MDPSPDFRPSPRQEIQIQGRRPAPLSVRKESHRIKKPPVAPPPANRDPVVIYSVSPKIIYTEPSEFMMLVQRLTGPDSADAPPLPPPAGALSPAARIASFERPPPRARTSTADVEVYGGPAVEMQSLFPGILTPMPTALPPISPDLFSPSFDLGFLLELSPAFASDSFLASPSYNFPSTPTVPSPGAFWDLMNQFPD